MDENESLHNFSPHFPPFPWIFKDPQLIQQAVGLPHQGKFQGKPCRVRGFSVETKGVGWAWTKKTKGTGSFDKIKYCTVLITNKCTICRYLLQLSRVEISTNHLFMYIYIHMNFSPPFVVGGTFCLRSFLRDPLSWWLSAAQKNTLIEQKPDTKKTYTIPSIELTYLTRGKGKSSSKCL